MEFVSELLFSSILTISYLTRNDGGLPLPIKESCNEDDTCWKHFDFWRYVVGDGTPENAKDILFKNFFVWSFFHILVHIFTHVEPQRRIFKPLKFNPNYPPLSLIATEIARSLRGVLIASIYEIVFGDLYNQKVLPISDLSSVYGSSKTQEYSSSLDPTFKGLIILLVWWDSHFYWTHRLLHTTWLYKNVHKVHHESYNPDPFSGSIKYF